MSITHRPTSYHKTSPKVQPTIPSTISFTFNKPSRYSRSFRQTEREIYSSYDNLNTKRKYEKLYEIDFDYGRLASFKSNIEQAPARANTPVKVSKPKIQLSFQQQKIDTSRLSTKAKFSTKSKYSKQNSTASIKSTKKRNQPLAINGRNLNLDTTIDPNQPKKNQTKLVKMLVGGKIVTKLITYPDISQYLKLCGIKKK